MKETATNQNEHTTTSSPVTVEHLEVFKLTEQARTRMFGQTEPATRRKNQRRGNIKKTDAPAKKDGITRKARAQHGEKQQARRTRTTQKNTTSKQNIHVPCGRDRLRRPLLHPPPPARGQFPAPTILLFYSPSAFFQCARPYIGSTDALPVTFSAYVRCDCVGMPSLFRTYMG